MYRREESVEEEKLDWERHPVPLPENKNAERVEAVLPPVSQSSKISLKKITVNEKRQIQRKATDLLDNNLELFLLFSISLFPYIVGFFISYLLFYFYSGSGMTIGSFFSMQQDSRHLELWGIGAYLFITFGIIWVVIKSLLKK